MICLRWDVGNGAFFADITLVLDHLLKQAVIWTLHVILDWWTSGIDQEEAFGGHKLECLIEGHDNGTEVAGSKPGDFSPPHHLNLIAIAGWAQAMIRAIQYSLREAICERVVEVERIDIEFAGDVFDAVGAEDVEREAAEAGEV